MHTRQRTHALRDEDGTLSGYVGQTHVNVGLTHVNAAHTRGNVAQTPANAAESS
jgi:hypothetical protein